jgi:hypothetical protein
MKAIRRSRRARGFVSYVMVLSIGAVLALSMLYAYRAASRSMTVASGVQQRTDYHHKEDATMRALLAIVPNRAILAMQSGSSATSDARNPLMWGSIFAEALTQANALSSISNEVASNAKLDGTYLGNTGDSALTSPARIFQPISPAAAILSSGCNNSLGNGFPAPLETDTSTATLDQTYPIISSAKRYGALASGEVGLSVTDYPQFNKIPYPYIDFGYGKPGEPFVAKRNWWAFSVDILGNEAPDDGSARIDRKRDYVLSIYEVPSQLAISANTFTSLGKHASGEDWQNIKVEGEVYAGKAQVEGTTALTQLASRRGMTLSQSSTIGGQSFTGNPFALGLREEYMITTGEFFPVSVSSETGRASFVPINRGAEFFDRFALATETNTLSPTTWNNYSVGALQCAMKLDVTQVFSSTDQTPTELRFTYKSGGADTPVTLTVNKTEWETQKAPFDVIVLPGDDHQPCVVFKPERLAEYLKNYHPDADGLEVNNSIAVNADYTMGTTVRKPSIPCDDSDIGLVLNECTDLTSFPKGFSVVTNFRLYIGDDFNIVSTTPPSGSGLPTPYYPPASLFAPERRFGTEIDPWKVEHAGQVGSTGADDSGSPLRPLDLTSGSGKSIASDKMTVNLKPITHPAALPPVTMMNWLVVLEERRSEFFTSN